MRSYRSEEEEASAKRGYEVMLWEYTAPCIFSSNCSVGGSPLVLLGPGIRPKGGVRPSLNHKGGPRRCSSVVCEISPADNLLEGGELWSSCA